MLLLTLRGTPTLYYGDELGMENGVIPPDRVRDPRELREPGLGLGRDPVRTPMPWDDSPQGGFTAREPWLPLGAGWQARNVANELADSDSMLALHRALLALRRSSPALAIGAIRLIEAEGSVLAYEREQDGERFVVALNLGTEPARLSLTGRPILSTLGDLPSDTPSHLRPDEGLILKVDTPA